MGDPPTRAHTKRRVFSRLADAIPDDYVSLLIRTLGIHGGSRILELGCGTGQLALRLAEAGAAVEAVDVSAEMIDAARAQPRSSAVTWTHCSVADLNWPSRMLEGVFSFEAFHLFPARQELVNNIGVSLRPGGVLAIGWRQGEWEAVCAEDVAAVFDEYGLTLSDWGYWTAPDFPELLAASSTAWTEAEAASIGVKTHSSTQSMAEFLCAIDRVDLLSPRDIASLRSDLLSALAPHADKAGLVEGVTVYGLSHAARLTS